MDYGRTFTDDTNLVDWLCRGRFLYDTGQLQYVTIRATICFPRNRLKKNYVTVVPDKSGRDSAQTSTPS